MAPAPFAVLAGDVIGSTELAPSALAEIFAALETAAAQVSEWQRAPAYFTAVSGDAWKVRITDPARTLRAALWLRAHVRATGKSHDTRIVAGLGGGELPPNGDLNRASGPAFVASGRGLDGLEAPHSLILAETGGALGAAFVLADAVSQGWTEAQARSVAPMLHPDPPSQRDVADRLGLKPQSVHDALTSAQFWALDEALKRIEGGEHSTGEFT